MQLKTLVINKSVKPSSPTLINMTHVHVHMFFIVDVGCVFVEHDLAALGGEYSTSHKQTAGIPLNDKHFQA